MYTLESLNRLSEIKADQDIKSLSHAIFPGTHCPLFGVALTASYVKNMMMIVIGTSECTYYTKNFAYHRQKGNDSVYSLVLDDKEVVFGAINQVEKAVKEIVKLEQPDAVMLVTTCVPELIGEDYSSIPYTLEDEVGIPIFVVNTEHFKCNSHIPGMSRALKSLSHAMEKVDVKDGVNIIGHRQDNVEETELVQLLKKYDVKIQTVIPSSCTIEEIKKASGATLNIVTDMIGLDLAKEMKRQFEIDYIYFDKHLNVETIANNYEQLSKKLNLDFARDLKQVKTRYEQLALKCYSLFKGKKLIYGNTPMMALEMVDFLSDLGLIPVFVQLRELYEQDTVYKENLLEKGFDPYISRIANIAPLRELYDTIGADLYVGHESPMLLKQKGMMQMTFDAHAQKIGYELPIGVMQDMIKLMTEGSKPMGGGKHAAM